MLSKVHKKELAITNTCPIPAAFHTHGCKVPVHLKMQDRDICSSPACFPCPVDKTELQALGLGTSYSLQCQIHFKSSSINFFSHLLPPHKSMKCLSGNRPYPRIPQDVSTGNLGLEKAAVVRTTCITNAAIAAYSLPGPTTLLMLHGLSPTRQAENEVKCSGNGLCHSFLCITKRPKWKHFWSSTIWAKMPKMKCCIEGGVNQTAAVDWLCTDKPGQSSQWAIHVCKDRDALSHTWAADLVNDNMWLTFARCTHPIAAF